MNAEHALEVYKVQHARFEKTREIQWKFNIATWTLLALAIAYVEKLSAICECLIWVLSMAYIFAHVTFIYKTQENLNLTKAIWCDILEKLNKVTSSQQIIEVDVPAIKKEHKWKRSDSYWVFFQLIVTLILITIFIALYYNSH